MRRATQIVVAVGTMFFSYGTSAGAQTVPCQATEGFATQMKDYLTRLVTATDPKTVAFRQQLSLPSVSASDVGIVSDTTTCTAAANAYSHAGSKAPYPTVFPVWVVRVGTDRYVVFNAAQASSNNIADLVIYDENFKYIVTIAV